MICCNILHRWHISCLTDGLPRTFAVPAGDRLGAGQAPAGGAGPPLGPEAPGEAQLPLWRRARRRAWWLLLLAVAMLAAAMPPRWGRAAGSRLARLALRVRPRERALAEANLALAFPEQGILERRARLATVADAAGRNLYDTLVAGRLVRRQGQVVDEADAEGRTLIEAIAGLAAAGRGVLVLSGHLGCWELLGAWLARELAARDLGPLHVVTGTVRNPAVDRWLAGRRQEQGLRLLPRAGGARPLARCLRAGGVAAVLVDQNTDVDNLPVPFFGHPAPTPTGAARLAVGLEVPVVVAAISRAHGEAGHRVRHGPVWRAEPGRPAAEQVEACLLRTNEQLESFIRRNPDEWVWYHQRWTRRSVAGGDQVESGR